MGQISRNEYGTIAVNDQALTNMIIDELLEMSDSIILCNKKGKIIKHKPTPFIEPDYHDAVIITDTIKESSIKIYVIVVFGKSISSVADELFERIGAIYDSLQHKKPGIVKFRVRGMKTAAGVVKREIEVQHSYE